MGQEEADDAKRRRALVPVLIENVQPPIGFRAIQAAHLENWDGTKPTKAFDRLTTPERLREHFCPWPVFTGIADENIAQ
jgi:hypothetical protein